ncbi:MAG: hypothetical protein M1831_005944 [Alyxoria varia]|nr:MAG: hypothetical protein M1831_005944 [Alyxoria varia]
MEVAAGVVAAEQVISTTVQGGAAAGAAIAYPTLPLKAKFECIGTSPSTDTPDSLARSSHTIDLLNGDLYIFGGLVGPKHLAGAEMHILKLSNLSNHDSQYKSIPALPAEGHDEIPAARAGHTTCTVNGEIIMYGGYRLADDGSDKKRSVDPSSRFWIFDPKTFFWTGINAVDQRILPRFEHSAVTWKNNLIIHGGYTDEDTGAIKPLNDTWSFDLRTRSWTELPPAQHEEQPESGIGSAPARLAVANDHLYLVSSDSSLSATLHMLDLNPPAPPKDLPSSSQLATTESSESRSDDKPAEIHPGTKPTAEINEEHEPAAGSTEVKPATLTETDKYTAPGTGQYIPTSPQEPSSPPPWQWHTLTIPTNPLTPGPNPRTGASLLPVHTGLGRSYLVLLFGQKQDATSEDDPSDESTPDFYSEIWTLQLPSSKLSPAQVKDAARERLSVDTGMQQWSEVQIVAKEEPKEHPHSAGAAASGFLTGAGAFAGGIGRRASGIAKHIRSKSGFGGAAQSSTGSGSEAPSPKSSEPPKAPAAEGEPSEMAGPGPIEMDDTEDQKALSPKSPRPESSRDDVTVTEKLKDTTISDAENDSAIGQHENTDGNSPSLQSPQTPTISPPDEHKPSKEEEEAKAKALHPAADNDAKSKAHPGPRAYFATAAVDGGRVVLWGGISGKGERCGDGWSIDLSG